MGRGQHLPTVLGFLERIQGRLVKALSPLPEAGPIFQGKVRMLPGEEDVRSRTLTAVVQRSRA